MRISFLALTASSLFLTAGLFAQSNVLTVTPPATLKIKIGSTVEGRISLHMQEGYHSNSNTPSDDYLIPFRLTWTSGIAEDPVVVYPKAQMEKYSFSAKPLSVFSGDFEIVTRFKVSQKARPGLGALTGKLRYQACNDRMCLPPKTIDVTLPVDVVR